MNLKAEYKRLFEGRQRSNDMQLLREAVELIPVQFKNKSIESIYGKDDYRVGFQGNKLFVSDKRYSKGKPIHVAKIEWSYIEGSNRLYGIYLYEPNKTQWTIKLSGFRADDVWDDIATTVGFKNGRDAYSKANIKTTSSDMDVS